jgi:hypothetical protein
MSYRNEALSLSLTLILVALAATPAAAAPAPATAAATSTKTISVASGGTSATLSYRSSTAGNGEPYSKLRLSIARQGVAVLERPVDAILCGRLCWPNVGIPANPVLRIADIEHDGSPDVILNLYSGGAHCCAITQVYRYDPGTQTYSIVQHDFADPGYYLQALGGGTYVFVSADDRFAYAFASFAFSGLPVEIWSFARSRFVDVTRHYPARVAADAARQYHAYLANRSQGLGLGDIAAWAADEDLLGHSALVAQTLAAQNRAGELRSGDGLAKRGSAFISQLQRFLVKSGYAT